MSFVIVEFTEENGAVDYVPHNWMLGRTYCRWPIVNPSILSDFRSTSSMPEEIWSTLAVRVLGQAGTLMILCFICGNIYCICI
jgi:hypothetical protein